MSSHSNHAVMSRIAIVVSGVVTFLILALLIAIIVWRVLASKRRQRASQNDATRELKRINTNMKPLFEDDAWWKHVWWIPVWSSCEYYPKITSDIQPWIYLKYKVAHLMRNFQFLTICCMYHMITNLSCRRLQSMVTVAISYIAKF